MSDKDIMPLSEEIETAGEALAWMEEWMRAEDLVQLARLLQEVREARFGVVKVMVNDRRVAGFRLEKIYK